MQELTETELCCKFKETGDISYRDALVVKTQPRIRLIAAKYKKKLPRHIEYDELMSFANAGLLDAIDKFKDIGKQFWAYAQRRVEGAVIDGLRKQNWFVGFRKDIADEIPDAISLSSFDSKDGETNSLDERMTTNDVLGSDTEAIKELLTKYKNKISERDRQLIAMLHRDHLTTKDIAKKLNITTDGVMHHVNIAIAHLQDAMNGQPLKKWRKYKKFDVCSVKDCISKVKRMFYCAAHLSRYLNHGNTEKLRPPTNRGKPCKKDGCKNKSKRNGFCLTHYLENEFENGRRIVCKTVGCGNQAIKTYCPKCCRRKSNIKRKAITKQLKCIVDGCSNSQYRRERCPSHYRSFLKENGLFRKRTKKYIKICRWKNCNNKVFGKGYCSKHILNAPNPHCAFDGCNKISIEKYCSKHKMIKYRERVGGCQFDGCNDTVYRKKLCMLHYEQIRDNDLMIPRCSVEGCGRASVIRGMCRIHACRRNRAEKSKKMTIGKV